MNGPSRYASDVALFIDWENFKISLAAGSRAPNVSALKEEVSNHGRVVVAKAYADWVSRAPELKGASQFINDPPALYAAGIEPVYVPTRLPIASSTDSFRTFRVKNSVDVKMTADCIECAHSYENINTFVLVSGDSDFIHVINALRSMGKRVIVIGVSWSTSRRLADQVDGLILYDADVDPVTAPEPAPASNGQVTTRLASPTRRQLPDVMRVIEDIVRTERQAGRTPLLTSLKQRVMRRVPGFDEKKLGFSGFKKLMQRVSEEGNIKLVTVGLVDWTLMAEEPEPEPEEVLPEASLEGTSEEIGAETVSDQLDSVEGAPEELEDSQEAVSPGDYGWAIDGETPTEEYSAEAAHDQQVEIPVAQVVEETAVSEPVPSEEVMEEIARLDLPKVADEQEDWNRVSDLIVAADTLEGQEGATKVAFNFLVSQVCDALSQGLEAENETISRHWGQVYSRSYVTKLVRSLDSGGVFQRGWHTFKDEDTGRRKRQRTFNLDRNHLLVRQALTSYWGIAPPAAEADTSSQAYRHSEEVSIAEPEEISAPAPQDVLQPSEVDVVTEETPTEDAVQPAEAVVVEEETPSEDALQPLEADAVEKETPSEDAVQPSDADVVAEETPDETPTDAAPVLVDQPDSGEASFSIDGEADFSTSS